MNSYAPTVRAPRGKGPRTKRQVRERRLKIAAEMRAQARRPYRVERET